MTPFYCPTSIGSNCPPPDSPFWGPGGVIFWMPKEPSSKRAVSFIDGQNLFRHAKDAFGHYHPNYDPSQLAASVCALEGWLNQQVRFYTGVPSRDHDPRWHAYWTRRLTSMRRAGVHVTSRPLRYWRETISLPDGSEREVFIPREKGIDLRLGLDVVRMARNGDFDVAIVFSQDQDLAEVASEIRDIARSTNRWLKIACAYPESSSATSHRGINGSDWIPLERGLYDSCLDTRDYRPANWWSS